MIHSLRRRGSRESLEKDYPLQAVFSATKDVIGMLKDLRPISVFQSSSVDSSTPSTKVAEPPASSVTRRSSRSGSGAMSCCRLRT